MYKEDKRIVMTLDAGGTTLVFTAIQGGQKIVENIIIETQAKKLDACLQDIENGFREVLTKLKEAPVAISFAFPGPADYPAGIIGNLPNFPAFCGGVALGPFLEGKFGLPVFINNDGNLFAYGEALTGVLPDVNQRLKAAGSKKQFRNLLGVTIGTGFGAGVVIDGELLLGDNAAGGDVWCLRNKKYPQYIVEESVSIRAVKRVYAERSGDKSDLEPKEIFEIAEGNKPGDREAAVASFAELGEMAGEAISAAITLIDGLVVVGGGIAGASKYIFPALLKEMNSTTGMINGARFNRLQMKAYNLDDEGEFKEFAKGEAVKIQIPGSGCVIDYDPLKRIGIITSKQGTNYSAAMGAYVYALNHLK